MINSAEELDAWYDAAAARVDAVPSNNRNQFNTHMVGVNPIYDDAYNDDVFVLFETAGITRNDNTGPVLNAIRGNNPNTVDRLEQRELLIAVLLDSASVPVKEIPDRGISFAEAGIYLKDTNPNANRNAFISHWAKAFGVTRAAANEMLFESILELEKIGAINSDYPEFSAICVEVAALQEVLQTMQPEDVFPI